MDLNCLFHQQQLSLMRADATGDADARSDHRARADAFGLQIRSIQRDAGAIWAGETGA